MNFFCKRTSSFFAFSVMLSLTLLLLFSSICLADDLVFSFGEGENANVTITSDKDIDFSSFKVNNPYRLVVNIKNIPTSPTEYLNKNKRIPKIQVSSAGNASRIILEPVSGIQLMAKQDSPRSITILGTQAAQEKAAVTTSPTSGTKPQEATTVLSDSSITAGTLTIKDNTITLGTNGLVGAISTASFPESNRFEFVFADTKLAVKLGPYKLDFLNLISMDVEQQGKNAKLTFYVKPKATVPNYFATKDKNAAQIRFFVTDPVAGKQGKQGKMVVDGNDKSFDKGRFKGDVISLDFDNADIRHVIRLLSGVNKKNYLITEEVKGTITLKLLNVPLDQAMELILKNLNLATVEEGQVTEIITFNQKVERIKKKLELEDFDKAQEQISICSVQLRNATAEKVSKAAGTILTRGAKEFNRDSTAEVQAKSSIEGSITAKGDDARGDIKGNSSYNAKEGKQTVYGINNIYAEPNTNRLIIRDMPSKFPEILKILSLLDVPDQQVLIEARIIEASADFTKSLGVQWGVHYRDGSASFMGINSLDTGFGGITSVSPIPTKGTSGPGIDTGISFGTLASNINLDLRFSAAATAGTIKIVSTPKIAVTYGEKATIKDGKKQPYQINSTTPGTVALTQFVDAVLMLEVTPTITPSCNVVMTLKVTNDSVSTGNPPAINQKSAETKLTVKNGQTAVIGGTYVDQDNQDDSGIPYLMDIPLLGNLFKSKSNLKYKREMQVYVTPKLLDATCTDSGLMQLKYEKLECGNF